MKPLAARIWNEPAAAIGLLVTLGLLILNLLGDSVWDAQTLISIVAPLGSALGIRQLVRPDTKHEGPREEDVR